LINGWVDSIDFPFTEHLLDELNLKKMLLILQRACDLSVGATSVVPVENPATIAIGRTANTTEVSVNF
jgi:hypothetical protein